MYGLPPPPRYNNVQTTVDGKPVSFVEVANKWSKPEAELLLGEGIYKCRDEVHIATPPPHPSEAPIFNPNPLATSPTPPTTGVKLYYTQVSARQPVTQAARPQAPRLVLASVPSTPIDKLAELEKESRLSEDTGTGTGTSDSGSHPYSNGRSPIYGAGNVALAGAIKDKDKDKRKKPKTGLSKTSSSFISRFVPKEDLVKRMELRNGEYTTMFASINRSFCWLDVTDSMEGKQTNWTKIMFAKAHPLCHDLNEATKSSQHMDVVIGTNLADILWYEPVSQRYSRLNKNGAINPSPVTQVRWIPGSENLFLAAHLDGALIVYDKERDDEPFEPEVDSNEIAIETPMEERSTMDFSPEAAPFVEAASGSGIFHINKSLNSKNQKSNPVAVYRISNQRPSAFAISPDSRHLAVVSEDGCLRIIDYLTETLTDVFQSYYDGFTCVCWSPDGRYVVTGGKDDLVTVWSMQDRRIIARCIGHASWVSHVAFDPWRCDGRDYRFGSVGEDQRLLLWDFGPGMLHAPRGARRGHKNSVVSFAAGARARAESLVSLRLMSTSSLGASGNSGEDLKNGQGFMEHNVESRKVVPELVPVFNEVIDDDPMSYIIFREDCIVTACAEGHVRTWDRPKVKSGLSAEDVHRPDTPKSKEESHPHLRADAGSVVQPMEA